MVRGSRHILGYLQDFLFEPKRARTPVKALSGAKNRLLLAKLFLKPSNLLILDEPTNDLDVETLELLEELLADYPGTLLLVSHDRRFIDNTVTGCWLFEGDGQISDYVGGYADMMATRAQQQAQQSAQHVAKQAQSKTPEPVVAPAPAATKAKSSLTSCSWSWIIYRLDWNSWRQSWMPCRPRSTTPVSSPCRATRLKPNWMP